MASHFPSFLLTMNYQMPRNLPEPAWMLDPPEAFQDDASAEENEQKQRDKEDAEIERYLDYGF